MDDFYAEQLVNTLQDIQKDLEKISGYLYYLALDPPAQNYRNFEGIEKRLGKIAGILEEMYYKE